MRDIFSGPLRAASQGDAPSDGSSAVPSPTDKVREPLPSARPRARPDGIRGTPATSIRTGDLGSIDVPAVAPKRRLPPAAGRRRLQMIDYPDDAPAIDHKGRSRPLYKPTTPRPKTWQPSGWARIGLGLVPGLRVMALFDARAGVPYAVLGLVALLAAVLLALNFPLFIQQLMDFQIDSRVAVVRGGALFGTVLVYELLRFAATLEERSRVPHTPRFLAALLLPSALILVGAPRLMVLWPRFLEAAWFSALVIELLALPPALWTALMGTYSDDDGRRRFLWIMAIAVAVAVIGAVVLGVHGPWRIALAGWALEHGFLVLPRLLH